MLKFIAAAILLASLDFTARMRMTPPETPREAHAARLLRLLTFLVGAACVVELLR